MVTFFPNFHPFDEAPPFIAPPPPEAPALFPSSSSFSSSSLCCFARSCNFLKHNSLSLGKLNVTNACVHPERFLTFVCPVTSISCKARRKSLSSHREGRPRIKAVPPDLFLSSLSLFSLLFSVKDDEGFSFASSAATISTLVLFFVSSSSSSPLGRLHVVSSSAAEGGASSSFGEIIVDLVLLPFAPEKSGSVHEISQIYGDIFPIRLHTFDARRCCVSLLCAVCLGIYRERE